MGMIDTLVSLKIILILVLGILILDEVFLGLQTAETTNFYAGRAALVDENVYQVDDFFNQNVFKCFIYTKNNPFVHISDLITVRDENTSQWVTKFQVTSNLNSHELRNFRRNGYTESSRIEEISHP
jgi:hypothetical protein